MCLSFLFDWQMNQHYPISNYTSLNTFLNVDVFPKEKKKVSFG